MKLPGGRLPWQMAALIGAVLLLALVVFRLAVFEAPRSGTPAAEAVTSAPRGTPRGRATVVSVRGEVERGKAGGAWSSVQVGQSVQADDLLRTGAHGATDLSIDGRSRVSLAESSEVSIRELTDSVHRFPRRCCSRWETPWPARAKPCARRSRVRRQPARR